MEQGGEDDGVLSSTFEEIMIGELVKCLWLEESLCIVVDVEKRVTSCFDYYHIFCVHDFLTGERFWVDEEDLEKV